MKIQIEQHEVEAAVREYMANQGIKVEGKTLSVEFKMTRADGGGLIANLNIDEAAPVKAAVTKATRAGTVGAAIDKQADKATTTTGTVNKLPTAAEAIADAQAKAAETKQANEAIASENNAADQTTATASADAKAEAGASDVAGESKTTTSLFS